MLRRRSHKPAVLIECELPEPGRGTLSAPEAIMAKATLGHSAHRHAHRARPRARSLAIAGQRWRKRVRPQALDPFDDSRPEWAACATIRACTHTLSCVGVRVGARAGRRRTHHSWAAVAIGEHTVVGEADENNDDVEADLYGRVSISLRSLMDHAGSFDTRRRPAFRYQF